MLVLLGFPLHMYQSVLYTAVLCSAFMHHFKSVLYSQADLLAAMKSAVPPATMASQQKFGQGKH